MITGFGVQYYQIMQPPLPDFNTGILMEISFQLANLSLARQSSTSGLLQEASSAQMGGQTSPSLPQPYRFVATLWFTALVCGLSAASIAMSVNQWLNNMLTPTAIYRSGASSCEQLRIWNLRHETFRKWCLANVVEIPSLLLQIALVLFLTGLVGYLWQLDPHVAIPALVLVALLLLFQFLATITPLFVAYSPFTSLQSRMMLRVITPLVIIPARQIAVRITFLLWANNNFPSIGDLLFRTYRLYLVRLQDIMALQTYGHNTRVQDESAYLQSEEGIAIDHTILANALSLIGNHERLRPIINITLGTMSSNESFKSMVAVCKRRPPILSNDVSGPLWAHGSEEDNIYITMANIVTMRISKHLCGPPDEHGTQKAKSQHVMKTALDALDHSLGAIRDAAPGAQSQKALEAYRGVFSLLSLSCKMDYDMVEEIITLIWRYDDYIVIDTPKGEHRMSAVHKGSVPCGST